jgi:uncharacterized protein (DUF952 family)
MPLAYKIVPGPLWRESEAAGRFAGSAVDRRDGYVHLSTAAQVGGTAALHFAGQHDLLLVAVDTDGLDVRWERSRGGALFPHLYGELPLSHVRWVKPLLPGPDGRHVVPDLDTA